MQVRPTRSYLANIVLSVETEWRAGITTFPYGLVFRLSDRGGYAFGITASGGFIAGRWDRAGVGSESFLDPIPLVNWTTSPVIRQQGANTLEVRTLGTSADLMINGVKVATITDGKYLTGVVGVFVEAAQEVAFDTLEIR